MGEEGLMRVVDLQRSTAEISRKTLERRAHEFKPNSGKCDLDRPMAQMQSEIGDRRGTELGVRQSD